jgi:hypothetical protein
MSSDSDNLDSRSNRIICAKLYEGGLLSSYKILHSIIQKPYKGKSPELELNLDLITKHAEVAFRRHMIFALASIALALLGFVFSILYVISFFSRNSNTSILYILFWIFSVAAICIFLLKPIYDRNIAFENFSRDSYKPDYNLNKSPENEYLNKFCKWIVQNTEKYSKEEIIKQNVIVFGRYFPFLGSGQRVNNWNFVIDTSNKSTLKNNCIQSQQNLSIGELYKAVSDEINKTGLKIIKEYLLYVDGNEIENDKSLLVDESKPIIYRENIDPSFNEHENDIFKDHRTYMLLKFHDEPRSTLLSTFLRFSHAGNNFFTECSFCVLTPINENIYNIDKLPRNNYFKLKAILTTIVVVIVYSLVSIANPVIPLILLIITLYPLLYILYHRTNEYKTAVNNFKNIGSHNYGILKTFRETIASPNYKSYFSAQDITMAIGNIEKSIIKSTADLLDEKGIDSSFIRNEMASIINYGIMQSGGTISNSPVASGDRSTITQFTEATQSAIKQFKQTMSTGAQK